ncbi:uncharacterized protein LOC113358945 [Papaver somniferum]|uniref:uncharacterized protein LOC113358945 n=1 Tax=Papaver somniferum TaxID=3469 RepID=UPI000E6FD475|nr:uncharacterized protein LOC113358945 [Papaver somniferum]
MALKLDFDKAYDRVSWPFVFKVLSCLGFDNTFIHWIKLWSWQNISDVKSTLLTSANLGRSFSKGTTRPLKVQVAKDPDGFISERVAEEIKAILALAVISVRIRWSWQNISDVKSTLLTSANLGRSFSKGTTRPLKVQVAKDPGGLGRILVMLSQPCLPLQIWGEAFLKERQDHLRFKWQRIQGWKSKTLNPTGRTTLIKSMLDLVSNHIMCMLKLPKILITKIDGDKRNVCVGGGGGRDKDKRSINKVGLEKVCRPLDFGGLGVRDLELNNLALLAKMAWRIYDNPESEVTKLLKLTITRILIFGIVEKKQSLC